MRIHTNTLTLEDFQRAMTAEKAAGRIADHVYFKALTTQLSYSHERAFKVQLAAHHSGDGRRAGNSGSYGAMQPEIDGYAATFDEWGWLLAALYSIDPYAVVGPVRHPIYADADDFNHRTGETYNPTRLLALFERGGDDPYPFVLSSTGGRVGRQGAYRATAEAAYDYWGQAAAAATLAWQEGAKQGNAHVKYLPRTAEWVREFAHLATGETQTIDASAPAPIEETHSAEGIERLAETLGLHTGAYHPSDGWISEEHADNYYADAREVAATHPHLLTAHERGIA